MAHSASFRFRSSQLASRNMLSFRGVRFQGETNLLADSDQVRVLQPRIELADLLQQLEVEPAEVAQANLCQRLVGFHHDSEGLNLRRRSLPGFHRRRSLPSFHLDPLLVNGK